MGNDEYAGSTRDIKCSGSTPNGSNGLAGSDDSNDGISEFCTESKTIGDKVCGSAAGEFILFIQTGWLKISPIIKEPFYIIGETIVNIFEHQIIRATVYAAIIVCMIAFFIMIGYVAALHEYGIALGSAPIGG